MVRDPLARFASVYLNKCFDSNCTNSWCYPREEMQQMGEPISFRQALNWMLRSDPAIDAHWKLQSEHCDLRNRIQEYTIVGLMTKETLAQDATCIMRQAGLERFNVMQEDKEGIIVPFWSRTSAVHAHRQESEDEVLKKLFTPESARELMSKLHQDYETFHLSEPTWVAEATGEWMDTLNHHSCY